MLLQDAQQLDLQHGAHALHLVQKKGSRVGKLKQSHLSTFFGPGKRTVHITEQFAFQKAFRQCRAVDGDKGPVPPVGGVMDGMGKQFLARTALSCDQDGGFGTGHLLGNVLYLPDRGAFSHDVVKDILGLMSFFQQLNPDFILPGFFFCEVPQDGNGTDLLVIAVQGYHIHIDGYPVDPDQPVPDGIAAGLILPKRDIGHRALRTFPCGVCQ